VPSSERGREGKGGRNAARLRRFFETQREGGGVCQRRGLARGKKMIFAEALQTRRRPGRGAGLLAKSKRKTAPLTRRRGNGAVSSWKGARRDEALLSARHVTQKTVLEERKELTKEALDEAVREEKRHQSQEVRALEQNLAKADYLHYDGPRHKSEFEEIKEPKKLRRAQEEEKKGRALPA